MGLNRLILVHQLDYLIINTSLDKLKHMKTRTKFRDSKLNPRNWYRFKDREGNPDKLRENQVCPGSLPIWSDERIEKEFRKQYGGTAEELVKSFSEMNKYLDGTEHLRLPFEKYAGLEVPKELEGQLRDLLRALCGGPDAQSFAAVVALLNEFDAYQQGLIQKARKKISENYKRNGELFAEDEMRRFISTNLRDAAFIESKMEHVNATCRELVMFNNNEIRIRIPLIYFLCTINSYCKFRVAITTDKWEDRRNFECDPAAIKNEVIQEVLKNPGRDRKMPIVEIAEFLLGNGLGKRETDNATKKEEEGTTDETKK